MNLSFLSVPGMCCQADTYRQTAMKQLAVHHWHALISFLSFHAIHSCFQPYILPCLCSFLVLFCTSLQCEGLSLCILTLTSGRCSQG